MVSKHYTYKTLFLYKVPGRLTSSHRAALCREQIGWAHAIGKAIKTIEVESGRHRFSITETSQIKGNSNDRNEQLHTGLTMILRSDDDLSLRNHKKARESIFQCTHTT
jgi:hypothetical protein